MVEGYWPPTTKRRSSNGAVESPAQCAMIVGLVRYGRSAQQL